MFEPNGFYLTALLLHFKLEHKKVFILLSSSIAWIVVFALYLNFTLDMGLDMGLDIQIKAVYMTVGSPGEIQVSMTYPGYPSSSHAHFELGHSFPY
jgi:hypothetical protein